MIDLAFLYKASEIAGSGTFDEAAIGGAREPGDDEARLMRDGGYVVLATAPFTVNLSSVSRGAACDVRAR